MLEKQVRQMHSQTTEDYMIRSLHNRFGTLATATMKQVGYFIGLTNPVSEQDIEDATPDAELKVDKISKELFSGDSYIFGYIMGSKSCRTELFDKINNINEATYPFMDDAAKAFLISSLTV